METAYLPGTVQDRILDLMKEHKVAQTDLAMRIGCSDSTLSRFLTGKTDKLGNEYIVRIAKAFSVSTDFLLGITNVPDKKNYEISELGLSVQAARNLYTHKTNPDVVNQLLESPRFAEVTYMIEQYFNDEMAQGVAGMNQMYTTIAAMLRGTSKAEAAVETARAINRQKVPVYQADLTTIQNQFVAAVKEAKKEFDNDFTAAQAISKETTQKMFEELTHGQDMRHPSVTPEQIADAVTGTVQNMVGVNQSALDKFGEALAEFMHSTLMPQENDNGDTEQ